MVYALLGSGNHSSILCMQTLSQRMEFGQYIRDSDECSIIYDTACGIFSRHVVYASQDAEVLLFYGIYNKLWTYDGIKILVPYSSFLSGKE